MNMEYTMSFAQTQKCLLVIDTYRKFYTKFWVNFTGTVLENLFNLMGAFEKMLQAGTISHPSNRGYSQAINHLIEVRKAVANILTSNFIFIDTYMFTLLKDLYAILTPSLNNYEGKVIRDSRTSTLYKVVNERLMLYSWESLQRDGNDRYITVSDPAIFAAANTQR